jgi:hypothetical protein
MTNENVKQEIFYPAPARLLTPAFTKRNLVEGEGEL